MKNALEAQRHTQRQAAIASSYVPVDDELICWSCDRPMSDSDGDYEICITCAGGEEEGN